MTNTKNEEVLITGSNRGLGRALVAEALRRGSRRVWATARSRASLDEVIALDRERVIPLPLDVTDAASVEAAARAASSTTLVINNAGVLASFNVFDSSLEAMRRDVETNYFGLLNIARSFGPALAKNGGALASVLTVASLASMPALGGYAASKAAAFSLTQALRGSLKGVRVHAIFPGPVDTDMIKSFDLPKTQPVDVARAIFEGIAAGEEDIFPDPMAKEVGATFQRDPRALEKKFAAM